MPKFPRNVAGPYLAQITPRNAARSDQLFLALNDGGHGSDPANRNAILWGLGATLNLQLGPHVRTWKAFVEAEVSGTLTREEITSSFELESSIDRRYRLSGAMGVAPLGLTALTETDHATPIGYTFILQVANVNLTKEIRAKFVVHRSTDIRHCPPSFRRFLPRREELADRGSLEPG